MRQKRRQAHEQAGIGGRVFGFLEIGRKAFFDFSDSAPANSEKSNTRPLCGNCACFSDANTAEFAQTLRIRPAVLVKAPIFRLPFPVRCAVGANWLVGQEVSGLAFFAYLKR